MANYCTSEEVRTELSKQSTSGIENSAIEERIPRACAALDSHCRHSFYDEAIVDEVRRGDQVLLNRDGVLIVSVSKGHCQSVSAVSVSQDFRTWTALDMTAMLIDRYLLHFIGVTAPLDRSRPIYAKVSYQGGFASADPRMGVIRQAAVRWTAFMYMKRDAPFEVTAFPEVGQVSVPSATPSDVVESLIPFVRRRP